LSVLGLVLVLWATGGAPDLDSLRRIKPSYVLFCLGLVGVEWLLEAWRLWLLSRAIGDKLTARNAIRAVLVGAFFAKLTPFSTGGEPFQAYALHQDGVPIGHATAVVAVKAILNGLTRLALGLAVPGWVYLTSRAWRLSRAAGYALWIGLTVYLFILGLAVLALVLRSHGFSLAGFLRRSRLLGRVLPPDRLEVVLARAQEHFASFLNALNHFRGDRRGTVILVGLLTVATWATILAVPVILVRALGGASPASELVATAIVFYMAINYVPTPGSSGASEAGFALLFARFVPLPLLGVLVVVWRLITHYIALLLGLLVTTFSLSRGRRQAAVPGPAAAERSSQAGSPAQKAGSSG
jgi:hypothetical protein